MKTNESWNEPQKVILAVMELLADPQHWTKGTEARDNCNCPRAVHHSMASKFCLAGAFMRVSRSSIPPIYAGEGAAGMAWKALERQCHEGVHCGNAVHFNDDVATKHEQVMKKLSAALVHAGKLDVVANR